MLSVSVQKRLGEFQLNVDFSVGNELLVLFGPSGSGKSLTLQAIAGLVVPDNGRIAAGERVFFDNSSGVSIPINQRRVGYVFQEYALFPHMTVHENIAYGIARQPKGEVESTVRGLLRLLRLEGYEGQYPAQLSGGQRQRVAMARALAVKPAILLMDEPLAALDYPVRHRLWRDLLAIRTEFGIPTIMVTHDAEEAFVLADRIAVISDGRIEQVAPKDDVFHRPATRKVAKYFATKNIFDGQVKAEGERVRLTTREFSLLLPARPGLEPGGEAAFCFRPEEVKVLRPDQPVKDDLRENIIEGRLHGVMEKGAETALFMAMGGDDYVIEIALPASSYRSLGLKTGDPLQVALRPESVWIIGGR
ncbi:MAG: ABC transporter ATP-binding protein [Nitrospirota bacterium]|nr:ABC transporter ATP-binding protein [Nitrospirota bacterium]